MFPVIGKKGDLEYLNQAAYLGCILLFQKPGFLGEDAAHHFAQKKASDFMLDAEIDELSPDEYREWEEIDEKYADIKALTNKEVQFALELLEKRARRIR
jgi:hypothetical protein